MSFNKFYPIFDNSSMLSLAVDLGTKFVQLRVKNVSNEKIKHEINLSKKVCDKKNVQLVINDYWELAANLNCDFVHLGQEDLLNADINYLKKKKIKIGISTHDKKELDKALSINPDYIAFGPIWETKLKKMKWKPQGLERLKIWKNKIREIPLVAIGGLDIERAKISLVSGADIVSVVTDISQSDNPKKKIVDWINEIK